MHRPLHWIHSLANCLVRLTRLFFSPSRIQIGNHTIGEIMF
jgi:hypothetical protein